MKVFKKWLDNYKKMKKNEEDKFPFLKLRLIRSYEKLADFYNISLKARGLEKPTTSDEGFLVVYRRLKGNINKLKTCPVKKNKPDGDNWYNKRNSQVKAKFSHLISKGWQFSEDLIYIQKTFQFNNFVEAFSWMGRIAFIAEKLNHHPNWSNVYNKVDISLSTHDSGGLTELDLEFANLIEMDS